MPLRSMGEHFVGSARPAFQADCKLHQYRPPALAHWNFALFRWIG